MKKYLIRDVAFSGDFLSLKKSGKNAYDIETSGVMALTVDI